MKQQDILIWMLKTMQNGKLPTPYIPGRKPNLIHILDVAEELGFKNKYPLQNELWRLGFLKSSHPTQRTFYLDENGVLQTRRTSPDFEEIVLEMHEVTSLVELRKRYGKLYPESWPPAWQEWQFPNLNEPKEHIYV